MKVDACDPCYGRGQLVVGEEIVLEVDEHKGVLCLCAACRERLDEVLGQYMAVCRIVTTLRCNECGAGPFDKKDSYNKHLRRHKREPQAERSLALTA